MCFDQQNNGIHCNVIIQNGNKIFQQYIYIAQFHYAFETYIWSTTLILCFIMTRRFLNQESCLLSQSHTFAIIVNISPTPNVIHQSMWIQWLFVKNQKVNDPKMTFDPTSAEVTCVTIPKDHCIHVPWKYLKVCGYSVSDPFFQKLEPKVIDP